MDVAARSTHGETAAVLLTGAPGSGKSSVLEKLATLFELRRVPFGALESEQLGWGVPWLHGEPWLRQLRTVLELQRAAGRRTFLIAATTETSDELAAVLDALGVDRVATVLLSAPPERVAARIAAREPDSWPGKAQLVEHARDLAVAMTRLEGVDLRLSTDGRSARDVAAELWDWLEAQGWPQAQPPSGPN